MNPDAHQPRQPPSLHAPVPLAALQLRTRVGDRSLSSVPRAKLPVCSRPTVLQPRGWLPDQLAFPGPPAGLALAARPLPDEWGDLRPVAGIAADVPCQAPWGFPARV